MEAPVIPVLGVLAEPTDAERLAACYQHIAALQGDLSMLRMFCGSVLNSAGLSEGLAADVTADTVFRLAGCFGVVQVHQGGGISLTRLGIDVVAETRVLQCAGFA